MTEALIEGEEWRHVHPHDREHFKQLKPDAEVVAAARARIPALRMSDVRLRLVRADGAPLRGQRLRLMQQRHAFVFGCSAGGTFAEEAGNPARRQRNQLFTQLFNGTHAKCYWDEKWHQPIETEQGRRILTTFLAEVDWALAHGLIVRGHPLVWTVPKAIPQWMRQYGYDEQLKRLEFHVRDLIRAAGGRVPVWDLVNEPLWEASLRTLPQRDWPQIESTDEMLSYIAPAVSWARAEAPDAILAINDYGLEATTTKRKAVTAPQQRQRFVALMQALAERGLAVDALGTQGHTGQWYRMDMVQKCLDELAAAGLPIHVTEFWASPEQCPDAAGRTPEEIAAASDRYVADYYTVVFGHPATTQLSYWGEHRFFDRGGWVPGPRYQALHELIRKEWWTDVELATDGDGVLATRAFHGEHRLRWTDAAGQHSLPLTVAPGRSGGVVTVVV